MGKSTYAKCKDSVVEIFFDDPDAALTAFHEPNYMIYVRPDEEYFSDTASGWSIMVHEHILYEEADVTAYKKYFIFFNMSDEACGFTEYKIESYTYFPYHSGVWQFYRYSRKAASDTAFCQQNDQ